MIGDSHGGDTAGESAPRAAGFAPARRLLESVGLGRSSVSKLPNDQLEVWLGARRGPAARDTCARTPPAVIVDLEILVRVIATAATAACERDVDWRSGSAFATWRSATHRANDLRPDVGAAPQTDLQIGGAHLAEGRFVHTKVHTFAAATGDALKRVEALSPWKRAVSQRVVWPSRRFPKLKVAGSNPVSRSILTRR